MIKKLSPEVCGLSGCDKIPAVCRAVDNACLPRDARMPINRCNLPAIILGSLTFQKNPMPLLLDGVAELHSDLFKRLEVVSTIQRAEVFKDYLTVRFCLESLEEAGLVGGKCGRAKADYVRTIRGWSFNSDSREGAVLKSWVESRFGLTPRYHIDSLRDTSGDAYLRYLEMRSQGLYGTNALESQLDLVYTFCQYQLQQDYPGQPTLTLYRGVNRVSEYEVLCSNSSREQTILLNNLNSFTADRDRACEFGDSIISAEIPISKIFFHCGLLPNVLQGEGEFLVIGGVVNVRLSTM
jgi:NAD+---dinitrogen-reductase ADP-D-ribosyltransferase